MAQTLNDLLFAHWPVPYDTLRPLVPGQLPLDVYEDRCWVAVTPFYMTGVRPRGIPPLPVLSQTPELNVRTYVTLGGRPGVFFFSLDAANRTAVWAAKTFYRLPYFPARMRVKVENGRVVYCSKRESGTAEFRAQYYPMAPVRLRTAGTLDHWLSERYCLYTVSREKVYRAEIHHQQWPLQDAEAKIEVNTVAQAGGIALTGGNPLLHFSKRLQVLVWPLRRVELSELPR